MTEQLMIDITYACNMRCLHCYNESGVDRRYIETSKLLNIAKQIAAIQPKGVCICGGETLLRYKDILLFTKKVKEVTQGNTIVNMVTNGLLLDKEKAINLKSAGIDAIQISLDGASANTYEWLRLYKGSFEIVCNAIRTVVSSGIDCMVSCLFTKKNYDEFDDIIRLCLDLKVSRLRLQPLMMMGRADINLKEFQLNDTEYRNLVQKIYRLNRKLKADNKKLIVEWGDPVNHLIIHKNNANIKNNSFGIDAYGNYNLSPYLPVTFGNIDEFNLKEEEERLENIWSTKFIQYIIKDIYNTDDLNLNKVNSLLPKINSDEYIDVDVNEIMKDRYTSIEQLINIFRKKRK